MGVPFKLFFELIKVSIGSLDKLSQTPSDEEWENIFMIAGEQALIGVCFTGIECLPSHQRPYQDLLLEWILCLRQIEERSRIMNERSAETLRYFRDNGFQAVILKGQGIAQLYDNPNRRISGDIDVWLDGGRDRIYEFARKHDKDGKLNGVNYHHIHYNLFDDAEVEVHIFPSYMNNPCLNHKLHVFCKKYPPSNNFQHPSLAFNRVFILLHCFNHFTGHGVGLRQIMDFYYVLKQGFTEEEKKESLYWIKELHLHKFNAAMMWLMKFVFDLDDDYLLDKPNEREGRFLLEEICKTGNMGHHDKRDWGSMKTPLSRFIYNLRRDAHFVTHYPCEIIWQPFFNIWLYSWRLCKGIS